MKESSEGRVKVALTTWPTSHSHLAFILKCCTFKFSIARSCWCNILRSRPADSRPPARAPTSPAGIDYTSEMQATARLFQEFRKQPEGPNPIFGRDPAPQLILHCSMPSSCLENGKFGKLWIINLFWEIIQYGKVLVSICLVRSVCFKVMEIFKFASKYGITI